MRCHQEMLMSWICMGKARWDILVKVLQDDLGEFCVADKIIKMLAEMKMRNLTYVNSDLQYNYHT